MTLTFAAQLEQNGPEQVQPMPQNEARRWCRGLAGSHYENFSVLSSLVPENLRDDFAAVYAFCRWADDLGDEVGEEQRSLELLEWWRRELHQCFEGEPRHPVFIALQPTLQRHNLPIEPFDNLIAAFEQDQKIKRYETWAQLEDYCRRSADPVGRLVLMMCSEPRTEKLFALSDATCTALQLTNHWQDIKRDLLNRDRIYIPNELIQIADFEERFRASARQGFAVDHQFLEESRALVRECVDRTWPLFERGESLLQHVSAQTRPIIWLFMSGGRHVLSQIEMWNYETALHRPRLGRLTKGRLVAHAWLKSRLGAWSRNGRASHLISEQST